MCCWDPLWLPIILIGPLRKDERMDFEFIGPCDYCLALASASWLAWLLSYPGSWPALPLFWFMAYWELLLRITSELLLPSSW